MGSILHYKGSPIIFRFEFHHQNRVFFGSGRLECVSMTAIALSEQWLASEIILDGF